MRQHSHELNFEHTSSFVTHRIHSLEGTILQLGSQFNNTGFASGSRMNPPQEQTNHQTANLGRGSNVNSTSAEADLAGSSARVSKLDTDPGWGLYKHTNDGCQWATILLDIGLNKLPSELRREDLLKKEFGTYDKAELFFNLYSKAMGFSVRKSHKKTTETGEIKIRTWLCAKEGHRDLKYLMLPNRKKEAKCLTREGCKVQFRVNLSKRTRRWVVKEFFIQHSLE